MLLILAVSWIPNRVSSKASAIEKYRRKIEALLKKGKSYEEIYQILDIWWPEEYPARFAEKHGRAGEESDKTVEQQMDAIIDTLTKRVAVDEQKLRSHPVGPKLSPEALKVIKFVAHLQENGTAE